MQQQTANPNETKRHNINIAGRLFASCMCVCVWACLCVRVMQYQSHLPQPFVQGNYRERFPDPNWASGTLHIPPANESGAWAGTAE